MSKVLEQLVEQLALEQIEENLFRGQSQDLGWGTVFGGQVLGQSLSAAGQTVPADRVVHSMHAYFLRPGNVNKPIVYNVDRIRDGSSFTTRRVVAIQSGQPIFNMAASFQVEEPGFQHQSEMPSAPDPLSVPTERERAEQWGDKAPPWLRAQTFVERPFEMRMIDPPDHPFKPSPRAPQRMVWMRADGKLPDTHAVHAALLAYASDFALLATALMPHGVTPFSRGMQVASLDHSMWFHQSFRADEWLLYVMDSPTAHGARGLARGSIYTRDGRLVASTAQEGLMRQRNVSADKA